MTPTTNHELPQYTVDMAIRDNQKYMTGLLLEIQSYLRASPVYEIGKEYEFSDDGEKWYKSIFIGYAALGDGEWDHIRPI